MSDALNLTKCSNGESPVELAVVLAVDMLDICECRYDALVDLMLERLLEKPMDP